MDHEGPEYGGEDDASQIPAFEVVEHLLHDEGDRCNGGVEGSGESGRSPHQEGAPSALPRRSEEPGGAGGDGSADVDARTHPAHTASTAYRERPRDELHDGMAELDEAEVLPEGRLELGDAAAGRIRAQLPEQQPHDQTGNDHDGEAGRDEHGERHPGQADDAVVEHELDTEHERDGRKTRDNSNDGSRDQPRSILRQASEQTPDAVQVHIPSSIHVRRNIPRQNPIGQTYPHDGTAVGRTGRPCSPPRSCE